MEDCVWRTRKGEKPKHHTASAALPLAALPYRAQIVEPPLHSWLTIESERDQRGVGNLQSLNQVDLAAFCASLKVVRRGCPASCRSDRVRGRCSGKSTILEYSQSELPCWSIPKSIQCQNISGSQCMPQLSSTSNQDDHLDHRPGRTHGDRRALGGYFSLRPYIQRAQGALMAKNFDAETTDLLSQCTARGSLRRACTNM